MVSVDQPEPAFDPALVGRAHRAIDPLHSHLYFAPEQDEHLGAVGLRPGRMVYFAGRAAPMGAVGAGVVTATFYNFSPSLVAHMIPRAWTLAAPEQVLTARLDAARASLTRLLGEEAAGSPEVAELAGLLREACSDLSAEGRPLYGGHADLPWPEEPLLALWHGATLLREHRGDGHVAVLLHAGLTGLEALITHCATGRGFTVQAAKATRGWKDEQWDAACAALADRGLLDDAGLTEEGAELRARIEMQTDALAADPWLSLGAEKTARVVEIGKGLSRVLTANGAFGQGIFGR
ncbi:hypothetical protein ABC795_04350 [Blastococcus sp. HT6-30]|uniref:SCO6745 family protein n=1 Tax=Blastococcus sp. HT6-30 TaxID=3144843 RepID=UPI00321AB276